ncbi:MAG: sugar transporter [Boseongicola sp.]|nr:sugar transporter [Boseongicola sp.]
MTSPSDTAAAIADRVIALSEPKLRNLIAVVGPPASGKTTLAAVLHKTLNDRGVRTGLVAMDGFHLDNSILDARALRARKGAPETFDLAGFSSLLQRLGTEGEVIAPTFDRALDASIGSSSVVSPEMTTVIVEGNYLLLNEPGWRDLSAYWSLSVMLSVSAAELEMRLLDRWRQFGFADDEAMAKARGNDLPNALRVQENSLEADMKFSQ